MGAKVPEYIFFMVIRKQGGRHNVELDSTHGTSVLTIRNISVGDAGTYVCGPGPGNQEYSAEVIVIGK